MILKKKVVKKRIVKKLYKKTIPYKKRAIRKSVNIKRYKPVLITEITAPPDNVFNLHTIGCSQSFLGAFQLCPQKFLFMVNRWKQIGSELKYEFGNIYHEILDQSFTMGRAFSNRMLANRLNKYLEIREKEFDPNFINQLHERIELAEMILQEYFKYYPEDFKSKIIIKPEQLFNVKIKFGEYVLRGKKDLRFCFKNNPKVIWTMEHKTKKRIDSDVIEGVLNFDLQNLYYITADDVEYGNNIQNVLYNIVRNPGHKQNKKETYKQFVERVRKDIQTRPEHFFTRYNCFYSMRTKKLFKSQLYDKFKLLNKFLNGEFTFYKNECACQVPYKCEYLDACASGKMTGYNQQKLLFPELEDSHYV